jgi:hypothetical protein
MVESDLEFKIRGRIAEIEHVERGFTNSVDAD